MSAVPMTAVHPASRSEFQYGSQPAVSKFPKL